MRQIQPPLFTNEPFDSSGANRGAQSGKARKNRRRLLRRLSEHQKVEFHEVKAGSIAAQKAVAGVNLKRAWLQDRGLISSALCSNYTREFFETVAQSDQSGCRVFVMECNDEIASVQIGFEHRGSLALHLIAFDLRFEKWGVGVLHLEDTINKLRQSNIKKFDLLSPAARYKSDWADGNIPVSGYAIACSWKGRAFQQLYLRRLRGRLKRFLQALPLFARRQLSQCLN